MYKVHLKYSAYHYNPRLAAKKKKEPAKKKYRSYTEARKEREKFRKRLVEVINDKALKRT